jgi:bifunctional ADP-heptose synthase (sugar kinase/adenylyltransferase)
VKRSAVMLISLSLLSQSAFAANKKVAPEAPMPALIVRSHKVFLANAGGSTLAFDEFYAQIKSWGRYQLVGSPSEAEIVLELTYAVVDQGEHVWSSTSAYSGKTRVHSARETSRELQLSIYDAKNKDLLWATTDNPRARFGNHQEEELVRSADRLSGDLRIRVEAAPPAEEPSAAH